MKNKEKVLKWIDDNFYVDNIKIKDFPVMPGGCVIKDKNGGMMLVYYDILTDEIKYEIK